MKPINTEFEKLAINNKIFEFEKLKFEDKDVYDNLIEILFEQVKILLGKEIGVITLQDINDPKSTREINITYTDEIMDRIKVIEQLKILQRDNGS